MKPTLGLKGLILLGASFGLGFLAANFKPAPKYDHDEVHAGRKGLINPLLECATDRVRARSFLHLEEELKNYLEDAISRGTVTTASIYFRDLNNGAWFGINEKEAFPPGSLMKVMVLIEFLKATENHPQLLSEKLRIDEHRFPEVSVQQAFPPEKSVKQGETHTAGELLERMIVYSDNLATLHLSTILLKYTGENPCRTRDGREICDLKEGKFRVVDYASLFRVLYNASYLSDEMSGKALSLLTQTRFNEGLPKGVPQNVTVAHKFGEKGVDGKAFFHDCGIVYHWKTPYLLCVLTQTTEVTKAPAFVAAISKKVYQAVDHATAIQPGQLLRMYQ
jgi:beta-lactamase class A